MASKNVILQMKLENVLTDIMVRTGSDNVIVDVAKNETLATRLASIARDLQSMTANGMTEGKVNELIAAKINALVNGAPQAYDTLKEIADYISKNQTAVDAINSAIGNKVDKVVGKGLSSNDFTTVLMNKLNAVAENATKTEKSNTNGNIKINGVETVVYTHPTGAGNNHIPTGGKAGQVLKNTASGVAQWADEKNIIKTGASAPEDLAVNELFFKVL